jgi:hypothetical protein
MGKLALPSRRSLIIGAPAIIAASSLFPKKVQAATTIWPSTGLPLNHGSGGPGNQGYVMRTECFNLTGASLGQVRVTVEIAAGLGFGNADIANWSIGVLGGATSPSMTTNPPIELKVSTASGFIINGVAGGTIVSDWANLSFLSTDHLIVDFDNRNPSASGGGEFFSPTVDAVRFYFNTAGNIPPNGLYATSSTPGFTNAGAFSYMVSLIETQAGAATATPTRTLMGVGL